ncbi:MAG TPA: hypothetical protein VLF91_01805 [Candidatus Saccharimonadales bacterium]|nr:hypothetical protein [Candidatus Saccharimonadales bacterium]
MKRPRSRQSFISLHKLPVLLVTLCSTLTLLLALCSPFLASQASADPGDTDPGGGEIVLHDTSGLRYTCQGELVSQPITVSDLSKYVFSNAQQAFGNPAAYFDDNIGHHGDINTYIGAKSGSDADGFASNWPNHFVGYHQIVHAFGEANGTAQPVIKFIPITASSGNPPDARGECSGLELIQVAAGNASGVGAEWRGLLNSAGQNTDSKNCPGNYEYSINQTDDVHVSPYCYSYVRFVENRSYDLVSGGPLVHVISGDIYEDGQKTAISGDPPVQHIGNFVIYDKTGGTTPPPGTVNVGSVNIEWLDASQINIMSSIVTKTGGSTDTTPPEAGEIYQKPTWDDNPDDTGANHAAVYLLNGTSAKASSVRQNLAGANRCENPYPPGKSTCGTGTNCTPYIAITGRPASSNSANFSLGFNPSATNAYTNFGNSVRGLGGASGVLVDYDANCNIDGEFTVNVDNYPPTFSTWFYYSKKSDQFVVVFPGVDTNSEAFASAPYVKQATGQYTGGDNNCRGVITVDPSIGDITKTADNNRFLVHWQLNNASCTAYGGALGVYALANENLFDSVSGGPTVTGDPGNTDTQDPDIVCNITAGPFFSWWACPTLSAMKKAAAGLDDLINSKLTIDTQEMFGDSDATGQAYHKAWASFRTIALAIIVIAALVMLISQAVDVPVVDAYTMKKVFPKIFVAAIGITLSWSLLHFFTDLSNDLGNGIRSIIYHPFSTISINATQLKNQLGGGSAFVITLLSTGGVLALGIAGLFSFILTGLLAVLIGFAMVVFRQVMLIFLVIVAPLAIAFWILPGTHKLWKLWYDSILGIWLVFLFISAFIAVGRVFSVISFNNNGTVSQLIGIIAYFAPYFLIPLAFRLAGGAIATIGGFVNDRSKGAFDRLKKFRADRMAQNWQKTRGFSRFSDRNRFTRGLNRLLGGAAAGPGGWLPTQRARGVRATNRAQGRAFAAKNNAAFQSWMNDNETLGQLAKYNSAREATTAAEARYRVAAARRAGDTDAEAQARVDRATVQLQRDRAAIGRASVVGYDNQNRAAAFERLGQMGYEFGDSGEVRRTAASIAGSDTGLYQKMIDDFEYNSKAAGRFDLSRGGDASARTDEQVWTRWNNGSLYSMANGKTAGLDSFIRHFTDELAVAGTDAVSVQRRTRAAQFFAELQAMQPNTVGTNNESIVTALEATTAQRAAVEREIGAREVGAGRAATSAGDPVSGRGAVTETDIGHSVIARRSRQYERPLPEHVGAPGP